MTGSLTLVPRLDLGAATALATAIRDRAGADLIIDAGQVEYLGALSAQILLAARQQWAAGGHRLTLVSRSGGFDDSLAVLGLAGRFAEDAA